MTCQHIALLARVGGVRSAKSSWELEFTKKRVRVEKEVVNAPVSRHTSLLGSHPSASAVCHCEGF